jgi:conjugative relaxase-like TrwC/TraI family protein
VLSIGKVTAGNVEYWEQQVAQGRDDYYSGKGESPGQWSGSGAEAIGLAGEVDGEVYRKVIGEGRDPESGERLRSSGRGGGSVLAFDLTFSAPKSVSLLYAVGDNETSEALREAHDEAVAAAMDYMEAEACGVRRGAGGARRLDGDGFISAKYRHRMSRAMDPQLHTHCVTANLTRGPDGRVSALDGERLYRQAAAGGHVYQAHLRAAVRERLPWWRWGEVRKGMAELETLEPALLREFSQRRVQIEEDLEENGRSRRRSAEKAALATRERKRHELGTEEWSADVRVRAAEHGLGRAELAALTGAPGTAAGAVDREELAGRLLGPAGLTENRNAFEHRDAVIAISAAHRDGLAAPRLRGQSAELLRRHGVLVLPSEERRFTTEELLGHERAIVESAKRRGEERAAPRVNAAAAERALAQGAIPLIPEQRAAVVDLATSGRGVESLEALAGTGKTTVAGALREVFESEGIRVMGVAPTARAARELVERAGIAGATTMARFRIDLERYGAGGGEGRGAVLIVDEAGMAATRETAAIVVACERANTKVIAIGDPGQLASVQAGGWLGSISQRFGARRLTEVMRQRDATERRLLARVHAGEPNAYVRHKLEVRALRRYGSGGEATQALVADWWAAQSRLPYGEAVMISRDNATRERLNAAARELLREAGRLGEAVELDGREFAVGDRVIARRNDRGRDLDNGMRATVRAVDAKSGEIVVETDASGVRELPASYARDHLEHAYALTGHGLQGGTVEWAGVAGIPSDFSRNWSYTALSRARGETRIYLVDEASRATGRREEIAPPDERSAERPAQVRMERAMRVRDDEPLALDHFDPPALPGDPAAERGVPIEEAHAERIATPPEIPADAARMRVEIAALDAKLDAFPTALAKRLDEARAERLGAEKIAAETEKRLVGLGSAPSAERAFEEQRLTEARRIAKQAAKAERELAPQVPNREAFEREAAPLRERRSALVAEQRARSESHAEAAVMAPGPHIVEALGSAPPDPAGRRSWERGVRAIERYRFEHGTSGEGPLGKRPERGEAARAWRDANDELVRAQRQLGRESAKSLERGR